MDTTTGAPERPFKPGTLRLRRSHRMKRRIGKYEKGSRPCAPCDANSHKTCRPRLDGTLCTCNCPASHNIAEEVRLVRALAQEQGLPEPTIEEAVKAIKPRYRQQFRNKAQN